MTAKAVAAKKAEEPKAWWHVSNFYGRHWSAEAAAFNRTKDGMSDFGIRGLWRDTVGDQQADISARPRWLVEIGIAYALQVQGQTRSLGKPTEDIARRYRLAREFKVQLLKQESEFYDPKYHKGEYDIMSKTGGVKEKRSGKERRSGRVTAASVLIPLLGAEKVITDERLIEAVKEKTGSSKFDDKQLAWYKWKYRQGKLKGMDGKSRAIAQGDPMKKKERAKADKKAAPAPVRKKLVAKKKAAAVAA